MVQVILLGPNETPSVEIDHVLLTEARCDSGERLVEVSGAVRLPGELEPAPISYGISFPSVEIAVETVQAYADARGVRVIFVRREG